MYNTYSLQQRGKRLLKPYIQTNKQTNKQTDRQTDKKFGHLLKNS